MPHLGLETSLLVGAARMQRSRSRRSPSHSGQRDHDRSLRCGDRRGIRVPVFRLAGGCSWLVLPVAHDQFGLTGGSELW